LSHQADFDAQETLIKELQEKIDLLRHENLTMKLARGTNG
jgi:hypothetical protein